MTALASASVITTATQPRVVGAWVASEPFRAWVRQLVSDTGLPWRVIARAAGVPAATVQGLVRGHRGLPVRRILRVEAERLLSLDHDQLAKMAGEPGSYDVLRLLMWSLGLKGCRPEQIAHFVGTDIGAVRSLMAGGVSWCSRIQQLRAEAACEAWGINPDEVLKTEASRSAT